MDNPDADRPLVDLVLPCLDEAAALPWVLGRVPRGVRPIVVDNGSADGSAELAASLGATVVRERRRGFGAACHAGLLAARAPYVAFCDCDASLDPAELPRLLAPLATGGADLVLGRRVPTARGAWPAHARLANAELARRLRARTGAPLHDLGPMRVAARESLLALGLGDRRSGYPLEMVLAAASAGMRLAEVPVGYHPRAGRSKVTGTLRGTRQAIRDMTAILAAPAPILLLLAKSPAPGQVKTRLTGPGGPVAGTAGAAPAGPGQATLSATGPAAVAPLASGTAPGLTATAPSPQGTPVPRWITAEQAAVVAEAALVDTMVTLEQIPASRRVLVLDGLPGTWLRPGWEVVPQAEGGLDRRLAAAFAGVAGETPALLVGMDTPQLAARTLAEQLSPAGRAGVDAWFGPATDGGFWALGLARPGMGLAERLLHGVPMSSATTGAELRARLVAEGLRVRDLPELTDVDTPSTAHEVAALVPKSRFARAWHESTSAARGDASAAGATAEARGSAPRADALPTELGARESGVVTS